MSPAPPRLERVIGVVLQAGVIASSLCLGAGLLLSFVGGRAATNVLLHTGVIVLLSTPVARVVVSIVEYINERDWTFVTLTFIVLLELTASAIAALFFNRRL